MAGCCPRFPLLSPGCRENLLIPRAGRMGVNLNLWYHVGIQRHFILCPFSSGFAEALGAGPALVSSPPSGQTHMLNTRMWPCLASGAPGDPLRGRSHTADCLLTAAPSLGLPGELIFSAADLMYWVGSDAFPGSTALALAWGPGGQITRDGWVFVTQYLQYY